MVASDVPDADRIPTEFRYEENLGTKRAEGLRARMRKLFEVDPRLPRDRVRAFAASYYDADPVAEAFIDEVYRREGQAAGRKLVDRALEHGIDALPDAPESLRRLFAEVEATPSWLDLEKVALGARVFRRFGTHMYSFAGAVTLHAYRESSVAKPLAFTGAYTGESANRRFLETASFWIDVSEPGALLARGAGRATALRVRLMHVFVRARLLAHPRWDLAAWGVPISQADAMLTLLAGSFGAGFGLRALGYRTSRDEILAMMHFWRYVGHLMGVSPRFYPETIEEALGVMFTAEVKGVSGAMAEGKELAHAYVASYAPKPDDAPLDALLKRIEHGLQLGYVRLFLPPSDYARFDLPSAGLWRLHPFLQAPVVFARETARRRSAWLDDWLDERARRETKAWVASRLGPRKTEYKAVEAFTR